MSNSSPWLWLPQANSSAQFLFVLIPCAGSSAQSYRKWRKVVPPTLELAIVQRPGRMERRSEEPLLNINDLLDPLAAAINEQAAGRPVILAGHSLGGLIIYELAARKLVEKIHLLVALAITAPHKLNPAETSVKAMDEMQFANYMAVHYQGIPAQLLNEPSLLKMFLPPLRGDMIMFEDYHFAPGELLENPILAVSSNEDHLVAPEFMAPWAELTTGPFTQEVVSGDHFLPTNNPEVIMPLIQKLL